MLKKLLFIFLFIGISSSVFADSYSEVVFDNSLVKGSYAKSNVQYSGGSWVENVNKNLLVSDTLFFTPGNALSLKYRSSQKGAWQAQIRYGRQKSSYRLSDQDFLSVRLYVKTISTSAKDLPKLFVRTADGNSDTVSLEKYIEDYETRTWIHLKIPLKAFKALKSESVLSAVGFVQSKSSNLEHHLFLDQIEFVPLKYPLGKLRTAAVLTDVVAYDKMIHMKWQLPLSPSIRYIKIYRAVDSTGFKAVAIRPIHMQSCLDVVPNTSKQYKYKITWVDYNYDESPFSEIKEVKTKQLNNDEVIDLIQLTHINYFVENFDVNSGMYLPVRERNKALVSTKETASAILALIVGAEKKFLTRQMALNRISKITYFLMRSQQVNGIFPAFFDGRKGIPEYVNGTAVYDVSATGKIIEALLIAKAYFAGDEEIEKDLRNRITALYAQIDWKSLLIHRGSEVLKSKFSLLKSDSEQTNEDKVALVGSVKDLNTYLLAIGANRNAINSESYFNGLYYEFNTIERDVLEEVDTDMYMDSSFFSVDSMSFPKKTVKDSLVKNTLLNPVVKYAVTLPFGEKQIDILDFYRSFSTINPNTYQDSLMNWKITVDSYVLYSKRKDNELGVGAYSANIWGFYNQKDMSESYRINPSIVAGSAIYDKEASVLSLLELYHKYGDVLLTEYGFRAWLDLKNDDVSTEYLARNHSALILSLENAKTGLIWKLYDSIPELQKARKLVLGTPAQPN